MKALATFVAAVTLGGCATAPIPLSSAAPVPAERVYMKTSTAADAASVVILRDKGFVGSASLVHVYINSERAASLEPGERVELRLDAGEYVMGARQTLSFNALPSTTTTEQLQPGRRYNYLVTFADLGVVTMARYHPDAVAK